MQGKASAQKPLKNTTDSAHNVLFSWALMQISGQNIRLLHTALLISIYLRSLISWRITVSGNALQVTNFHLINSEVFWMTPERNVLFEKHWGKRKILDEAKQIGNFFNSVKITQTRESFERLLKVDVCKSQPQFCGPSQLHNPRREAWAGFQKSHIWKSSWSEINIESPSWL